jgi:hypothetical protein
MNEQKGSFSKRSLIFLGSLFLIAYVAVFAMFIRGEHPKLTLKGVDEHAVHFHVNLMNIDLTREVATFTFLPDLESPEIATGGRLKADISVELDAGQNVLAHTFKKGDTPAPWAATMPLDFGDVLEYPFDKYGGSFFLKVMREGSKSSLASLDFDKVVHGFVAAGEAEPTEDKLQIEMFYEFSRSPSVIFLSMMAMVSLSLVVFSAVSVAKHVALKGRKVEFGMLVWIAALLFVIPAARNSLPGGPPLGGLIDIVLFFWLQMLGVASLLVVVSEWKKQT